MPVCGPVNMGGVETISSLQFSNSFIPRRIVSELAGSWLHYTCRMKTKEKIDPFFFFFKLFLNMGRLARSWYLHMWQEQSFLFSLTKVFPGFALLLRFPALKLTGHLCRTAYSCPVCDFCWVNLIPLTQRLFSSLLTTPAILRGDREPDLSWVVLQDALSHLGVRRYLLIIYRWKKHRVEKWLIQGGARSFSG